MLVSRLRRIVALRLRRGLREVSDPGRAAGTAAALGAAADPPVTAAGPLSAVADVLAGVAGDLPADAGARLGLPDELRGPHAGFDAVERELLGEYLRERGVVGLRGCRGARGRTALLDALGVVDRAAAPRGAA